MAETPHRYDLRGWLGIFHPAYRRYLFGLLAIGLLSGVLTYLNLELLQGLVKTVTAVARSDTLVCPQATEIHLLTGFITCSGIGTGWAVALLVLAAYALMELLQAFLGVLRLYVQGLLEIRSRNDIEREILINLLRKDDQFFQRHSATQIANRLSEDTSRIFERREDISALWSVSVQAVGALVFLWSQNWSYAAAVLLFSLIGVYIIHRMLGRMKYLDGAQLQADDNVKAAFEDYLHAMPEAQMGNLTGKITRKLAGIQEERQSAFMGLVNLTSKLNATYAVTQLVAFSAIMCAIIYVVTIHGFSLEDGLVAAVVRAVPQLYGNISEIAKLFLKFQLADVSARRLLEYETESEPDTGQSLLEFGSCPERIVFEKVRYAFTPGGPAQGGPDGISLALEPNTLNVIVGPSGSGKSMLSQLLLGRMRPTAGMVRYGETEIHRLRSVERARIFSYMPQSLALIAGSIAENIRFGLADAENDDAQERVMAWVDRTAVGRFARQKALDMPTGDIDPDGLGGDLSALRKQLRARVAEETGVELRPFSEDSHVPHFTLLEQITGCAAHPEKMLPLAFSPPGFQLMDRIGGMPGADAIAGFGQHVVERTIHLLARCPSPDAYNEIAPFALSPPVWEVRSNLSGDGAVDAGDPHLRSELILAGLTASLREAENEEAAKIIGVLDSELIGEIRGVLAEHFHPALERLDADALNPALNWRDNLLYAAPSAANVPAIRSIDESLLKAVGETGLDTHLLETGLEFHLGRQGKRLSGGQRQLICLSRAFLQEGPVLVLDEPTAALDPDSREKINRLIREHAAERTIVAITHDAELARLADQVLMVRDGKLWCAGSFDQLAAENAEFRSLAKSGEMLTS